MKKFTKTLLTLGLLVGGLAGCGQKSSEVPSSEVPVSTEPIVEKFTVEFWLTDVNFISEQEVEKGEKVEKPDDPVRLGYTFDYWGVKKVVDGEVVVEEYDFTLPVNADLEIYAQWEIPYSPDPNRYTLVGSLANRDYDDYVWYNEIDFEGLEMKKADPEAKNNEFSITLDLGYNAELKVKTFEKGWPTGLDWGSKYFVFDVASNYGPKHKDGDDTNVVIKNAGNYSITLITTVVNETVLYPQNVINIVRNGDPLQADKVDPNPEEGASVEWRLSGNIGIPGYPVWSEKTSPLFAGDSSTHVYTYGPVYLRAGATFKLTKDGAWDGAAGYGAFADGLFGAVEVYGEGDTLPTGAELGDPKLGSDLVVLTSGFYLFEAAAVDKTAPREELEWTFSASHGVLQVAGSINDWGNLANPNAIVLLAAETDPVVVTKNVTTEDKDDDGNFIVVEVDVSHTYTISGELELAEGDEWKVRAYGAWNIADLGIDKANIVVEEAGTYEFTVELVVTYGEEALEYAISFVKAPVLKA